MLNHYFILCRWALFTKEHYVLAHYKNKCISLCFLKDPWKSIGALLLFCCGGVHLKMQIRADQSEALKPEPCQPIRSSKTWATLSAVIPSYTEPPITSYFSDWSSFLYNLFGLDDYTVSVLDPPWMQTQSEPPSKCMRTGWTRKKSNMFDFCESDRRV